MLNFLQRKYINPTKKAFRISIFRFINWVDKEIWSPQWDSGGDVSSVNPSHIRSDERANAWNVSSRISLQTNPLLILYSIQAESFPGNLTKLDIRHSSGHPSAFRLISLCLQSLQCLGLSDQLFASIQMEADKRRVFASLEAVRILEFSYCSLLIDLMVRYIAEYCRWEELILEILCSCLRLLMFVCTLVLVLVICNLLFYLKLCQLIV